MIAAHRVLANAFVTNGCKVSGCLIEKYLVQTQPDGSMNVIVLCQIKQ